MALGAGETTLVQITAAYGQLVNGGLKVTPSLIDRVQDRYGKTIMRHDTRRCEKCVVETGWKKQPVPKLPDNRVQLTDPSHSMVGASSFFANEVDCLPPPSAPMSSFSWDYFIEFVNLHTQRTLTTEWHVERDLDTRTLDSCFFFLLW